MEQRLSEIVASKGQYASKEYIYFLKKIQLKKKTLQKQSGSLQPNRNYEVFLIILSIWFPFESWLGCFSR